MWNAPVVAVRVSHSRTKDGFCRRLCGAGVAAGDVGSEDNMARLCAEFDGRDNPYPWAMSQRRRRPRNFIPVDWMYDGATPPRSEGWRNNREGCMNWARKLGPLAATLSMIG